MTQTTVDTQQRLREAIEEVSLSAQEIEDRTTKVLSAGDNTTTLLSELREVLSEARLLAVATVNLVAALEEEVADRASS